MLPKQIIVSLLVFCLCRVLTAVGEESSDKVFLGYVSGLPAEINYCLYTHLAHAFLLADKEGTIKPQPHVPSRKLTQEGHQAGVKVLLSLGGWGSDSQFAEMSLNSQAEDIYVRAVMEVIEQYDYDGIDFDWEYPDTNIEIVGFERLSRRFRKKLDELGQKKNRTMLLTMAASAHPKTLEWLSNEFLLETMDWINVMTYDYTGRWSERAGHHAPLFPSTLSDEKYPLSATSTMEYLLKDRGFPANRLALGIPLYGRVFNVGIPYSSTTGALPPVRDAMTYTEIFPLLQDSSWKRVWDEDTKNPWLIAKDGTEVVCYDDLKSVGLKTAWAMQQQLRGVFFWQVDGDRLSDGTNPLQEEAHKMFTE